jgi:hypothetical protein
MKRDKRYAARIPWDSYPGFVLAVKRDSQNRSIISVRYLQLNSTKRSRRGFPVASKIPDLYRDRRKWPSDACDRYIAVTIRRLNRLGRSAVNHRAERLAAIAINNVTIARAGPSASESL